MNGPSNTISPTVSVTPKSVSEDRPKASLQKGAFDTLVRQKGYPIYIDKTVKCPCSTKQTSQGLPGCRNCGGTGYVVYNRREAHAIIHSINRNTQFKEWSEESLGTASLTTYQEIELSFMDKIVMRKGTITFNELIFLSRFNDNEWRGGLKYPPILIQAAFLFIGEGEKLKVLELGTDYVIENNQVLHLTNTDLIEDIENPTISIRYTHYPEFLVLDIPRNTIASLSRDPQSKQEDYLSYPVHAIIKTLHYVLNVDSNNGTYLLDNSFEEKHTYNQ